MKIFLCSFMLLLTIPNAIFSTDCPEYCSCQLPDSIFCHQRYSPDFPKDIHPAISRLYLFNNGIEVIKHEDFDNLNNLELLDLSQNKLKQLPDRVFELLTSLKNLDLSSNQITHISEDCFHGMTKLERLYLYSNHITTIHPAAFDGLENLLELKLQNNLIKTLFTFSMPRLLLLDLSYNLLPTLSPSDLETPNLESLKLASVGLTRVNDHLLRHLKNLHELDISGNHFTSFPSGVKEIHGLLSLNIAGNPMNPLKPEDLQNLKELNELDISSLGLHGLPEELPLLLPNLKKLRVAQNPFNCLCSLAWFPKWLTDQGITLGKTEETRCHFPLSHARKILKTMKYSDFGCPSTTTVTTTTIKSTTTTSVPVNTLPTTTKAGKVHKAVANPDDNTPPFVTDYPSSESLDKSKEHFCPPQTCLNGGTCILHEHGQVECTCPYGTSGMYCEIQNPSLPSPPEPESPGATVTADQNDITLSQQTGTSICLNVHRYIELRPYLNGIRITYRNLSGSDQRPRELSLPKSISEYTLRGLNPDSIYSICVSPFGAPTGTDRVCTKGRTNNNMNSNFSKVAEPSPSVTPPALVPATAILLVLVLIAIAIGVVCYLRWKKGKGHMDLHCEPSQLELDGVKVGLDNEALPQKQPQHMNPEPAVQNGSLEYVLLLQDHCASHNIRPSHKPPYF